MNRIVNAIYVDEKNIADIFKLPCVAAIHKYSEPAVFVNLSNSLHFELAWPGDWICQLSDGRWSVLSNKDYQESKQNNYVLH